MPPYKLKRSSSDRCVYPSASHFSQTVRCSTGISTCSPSAHALALPLGPTNPPRIILAAEPLDFRRGRFALPFSVTRSGIRTRNGSTAGFRCSFTAITTLPYHRFLCSVLRYDALAPLDCRRIVTRPVSCYALFQGWLLLSQPPGCLCNDTSFPTQHQFRDLSSGSGLFPSRQSTFAPTVSLRVYLVRIRSLPSLGRR